LIKVLKLVRSKVIKRYKSVPLGNVILSEYLFKLDEGWDSSNSRPTKHFI